MNLFKTTLLVLSATVIFSACKEDDVDVSQGGDENTSTFIVEFEPKAGDNALAMSSLIDTVDYNYITDNGQAFNVSEFSFYATAFTLSGPNGETYSDELEATASGSKGYYKVIAGENSSYFVKLENIPVGTYDHITFTLGVGEEGVESGAAGGVLDIANGGFWNWNAGYVSMLLEGLSPESPQVAVSGDGIRTKVKYQTALHIGGWKDVVGNDVFVNNLRTVSLDFGTTILVGEDLNPLIHINADVLKFYNDSETQFSTDYSVHSPKAGAPFADPAANMFVVDHVHQ